MVLVFANMFRFCFSPCNFFCVVFGPYTIFCFWK